MRTCAKLACGEPATATMALRYRDRMLWISDLIPERDPNLIDLCVTHANGMVAPYGWELVDERRPIELPERLPEPISRAAAATG